MGFGLWVFSVLDLGAIGLRQSLDSGSEQNFGRMPSIALQRPLPNDIDSGAGLPTSSH